MYLKNIKITLFIGLIVTSLGLLSLLSIPVIAQPIPPPTTPTMEVFFHWDYACSYDPHEGFGMGPWNEFFYKVRFRDVNGNEIGRIRSNSRSFLWFGSTGQVWEWQQDCHSLGANVASFDFDRFDQYRLELWEEDGIWNPDDFVARSEWFTPWDAYYYPDPFSAVPTGCYQSSYCQYDSETTVEVDTNARNWGRDFARFEITHYVDLGSGL